MIYFILSVLSLSLVGCSGGDSINHSFKSANSSQSQVAIKAAWGSTELSPNYSKHAIDGDLNTRWESAHNVDPSSIKLWLADKPIELRSIEIHWENANAAAYSIEGSVDDSNWSHIAYRSGGSYGDRVDNIELHGKFRFIQINCHNRPTANKWGYSIKEIKVFKSTNSSPPRAIKVMTYNVRTTLANDTGEGAWGARKGELMQVIRRQNPDILGLQEAEPHQYQYILNNLGHNWTKTSNNVVLYNRDVFKFIDSGVINVGGDMWGARTATWVKLKAIHSNRSMVFLNTHWGVDHDSQSEASYILKDQLASYNENWALPTILLGDLNASPNSSPIRTILNETPLESYFSGKTFNEWQKYPHVQLDYIMGHKFNPKNCKSDWYREGDVPPSDHYPIICDLEFE